MVLAWLTLPDSLRLPSQEFISMYNLTSFSHSYGQSIYHIVLIPYKRRKIFNIPGLKKRMENIFQEIFQRHNINVHVLRVMADHVHIFLDMPGKMSLDRLFQVLKGLSSYMFFKDRPEMREHFKKLWSAGKFFRTVGSVTASAVEYYIKNQ